MRPLQVVRGVAAALVSNAWSAFALGSSGKGVVGRNTDQPPLDDSLGKLGPEYVGSAPLAVADFIACS